jgi:hypothetical protein
MTKLVNEREMRGNCESQSLRAGGDGAKIVAVGHDSTDRPSSRYE